MESEYDCRLSKNDLHVTTASWLLFVSLFFLSPRQRLNVVLMPFAIALEDRVFICAEEYQVRDKEYVEASSKHD